MLWENRKIEMHLREMREELAMPCLEDEQAKSRWNWVVVIAVCFIGAFIMRGVLSLF